MYKTKAIGVLKKRFIENIGVDVKEIQPRFRKIYLDPANVMGIIPKTHHAKEWLLANFDVGEGAKVPELDYKIDDKMKKFENGSRYSIEYLNVVLDFIKCSGDETVSVKLSTKKDYPLKVELNEFDLILAPRVEND